MLGLGVSGGIALWVSILTTPVLLRWLRKQASGSPSARTAGQPQRQSGHPTMGGIAWSVGCHRLRGRTHRHRDPFSRTGYLAVMAIVLFGGIGFLDDWIKVRHQRSLGLTSGRNRRPRSVAPCSSPSWPCTGHTSTALSFTRSTVPGIDLGQVGWVVSAVLVMVGTSNAVNITDGVDGLAAGASTFCFAVLAIMGYWIFPPREHLPRAPGVGHRPRPRRGGAGRGLHRIPLVERCACPNPSWGHRFAVHRCRAGRRVPLLNLDLLLPIIGGLS